VTNLAPPAGYEFVPLARSHRRAAFDCGNDAVNDWLKARALQNQQKRLSTSKVLANADGIIAGFFTLATGQADFSELPAELVAKLPRRALPIAIVAWLGVGLEFHRQGIGTLLVAKALADCHAAGQIFNFVALVLDCIDEQAKAFYQRFDFREIPGKPLRLFLPTATLDAMMRQK
jgi:ribosomal protein S18 acetylase RimI-like enzyme